MFFIRTNENSVEPDPTQKQLDVYMRKNKRYEQYLEAMYAYGNYNEMPTDIKYSNGGKLSYTLRSKYLYLRDTIKYNSKKEIKQDILEDSFEDGLFSGMPGTAGVYPTRKTNEELGVIDCRKSKNIVITQIKKTKKSKHFDV